MIFLFSVLIFNVLNVGNSFIFSSVNIINIVKGSSNLFNVIFENFNVILIVDDIVGILYVRVLYIIIGFWYGNGLIFLEFNFRGFLIGKFIFR